MARRSNRSPSPSNRMPKYGTGSGTKKSKHLVPNQIQSGSKSIGYLRTYSVHYTEVSIHLVQRGSWDGSEAERVRCENSIVPDPGSFLSSVLQEKTSGVVVEE